MQIHTSYLKDVLDVNLRQKTVDNLVESINLSGVEFDAVAFTGMSGALIAPEVASKLNKPVLMVRKEKDNSHSSYKIEGALEAKKYIIIDDCIVSGQTICNIQRMLRQCPFLEHYRTCVATFLYVPLGKYGNPYWMPKERFEGDLYFRDSYENFQKRCLTKPVDDA